MTLMDGGIGCQLTCSVKNLKMNNTNVKNKLNIHRAPRSFYGNYSSLVTFEVAVETLWY